MKSFKLLCRVLLSISLLGATQVTIAQHLLEDPELKVSEHDNEIVFFRYDNSSTGTQLAINSFTNVKHSITAGQFFSGVIRKDDQTLVVKAGRHGSATPVEWLKRQNFPLGGSPQNLNFAVTGDLILDMKSPKYTGQLICGRVALAQGHTFSENDWWVYSNIPVEWNDGLNSGHTWNKTLSIRCQDSTLRNYDLLVTNSGINRYTLAGVNRSTNQWMGELPDDRHLNQIIMPGSHDAGMSEANHCSATAGKSVTATQSRNIYWQAMSGSRYYDIRVDYDYDELWTYHRDATWGGCSGQRLRAVLDQAKAFLAANPTETLIFKFSHTRDFNGHSATETVTKVLAMLRDYNSIIYQNGDVTNLANIDLASVRGKLITVFDYEYNNYVSAQSGIYRYRDSTHGSASGHLNVFDQYSNSNTVAVMRDDQSHKLENFGGLGKNYLFLLSYTLTLQPVDIVLNRSIEELANVANKTLNSALDEMRKMNYPMPNIVYIDFIDPTLGGQIIDRNYGS